MQVWHVRPSEICVDLSWCHLTWVDLRYYIWYLPVPTGLFWLLRYRFDSSPSCTSMMRYTSCFLPPICLNELQNKAVHVSKILSSAPWRKGNSIVNLVLPCYPACTGERNGSECIWSSTEMTPEEYEQSMYVEYYIRSTSNFHSFSSQTAINTTRAKNPFQSQWVLWFYTLSSSKDQSEWNVIQSNWPLWHHITWP